MAAAATARCQEAQLDYAGLLQPDLQRLLSVVHIVKGHVRYT
jgi:hypothetical protein